MNTGGGYFDHPGCRRTGRYHGDTCLLRCYYGFELEGSHIVKCDNGEWNDTIGKCNGEAIDLELDLDYLFIIVSYKYFHNTHI